MITTRYTSFALTVILIGCWDPDPRSARGALDLALRAIEAGDGRQLYKVIDERARHALISISADRRAAAELVRQAYPPEARARALADLGDAAVAPDAAALFALRCAAPCMAELRATLGAPVREVQRGDELELETVQGATVRVYKGSDSWWGIVWHTDALSSERDRAAQALRQIRDNAEIYRRRRALDESARNLLGTPSQTSPVSPASQR